MKHNLSFKKEGVEQKKKRKKKIRTHTTRMKKRRG